MEIAGLTISMLALLFSLYTYLKHDNKIKKQAALINEYQIEKIEKKKTEEKKAIIEINPIKSKEGQSQIEINNKGKSIAKNFVVSIPNMDGFRVKNNPCPIDIKPQNGIKISLVPFISGSKYRPEKIEINYKWSDEFGDFNNDKQTIQI
ncbi:MAG: hypothetical protein WC951_09470 [Bacteroidales bacterium]